MIDIFDDRARNYPFFKLAWREHNDSIASNKQQDQMPGQDPAKIEWFDDPYTTKGAHHVERT